MTIGGATINIPNVLTVTRMLLVPLFVILLIRNAVYLALVVFAVMAASDFLDGLLARLFRQESLLGAYLDPVADKLLMTASFVTMAMLKFIPSWLTVLVISRDVLICTGMFVFVLTGSRYEMGPSRASKWTTASQLTAVFFTLLAIELPWLAVTLVPLYAAAAGMTVFSGLHYIYLGMNILQASGHGAESPEGEGKGPSGQD